MPRNIFLFVSKYHGAGKSWGSTRAVEALTEDDAGNFAEVFEFTDRLQEAAAFFTDEGKDEPNELGVTRRQIVLAMSPALSNLHPELPVFQTKKDIIAELDNGGTVFIPDCRRPTEFEWARSLPDVAVHVIEVVPTARNYLFPDDWITPDIIELWGADRYVVVNDFTDTYDARVAKIVIPIIFGEKDDKPKRKRQKKA